MQSTNSTIVKKVLTKFNNGGNKKRKQKKAKQEYIAEVEDEQMFAQIISCLGGRHFSVLCTDNIERNGRISSEIKKGIRLVSGTFVIISLRSCESEQGKNCDIIGIANPPNDIVELFKKNKPTKSSNLIFCNNSDKFNDIINNNNNNNNNNNSNNNSNNNETNNNETNIDSNNLNYDDINYDDI